jgi:Methyltransferase domain
MQEHRTELEAFLSLTAIEDWEPGFDEYREHISNLTRIINKVVGPSPEQWQKLEGNLFYEGGVFPVPEAPLPMYRRKRQNFAVYVSSGTKLLEIGFNAGHSAMLALTTNRRLHYVGIDIGVHAYTVPCFDYLHSVFGERVNLLIGDSREVLPRLSKQSAWDFDLFHIDGSHGFASAESDLCNILNIAKRADVILFDDVDFKILDALCDYYVLRGLVARVAIPRIFDERSHQRLLRVL